MNEPTICTSVLKAKTRPASPLPMPWSVKIVGIQAMITYAISDCEPMKKVTCQASGERLSFGPSAPTCSGVAAAAPWRVPRRAMSV